MTPNAIAHEGIPLHRVAVEVRGAVQGVGFRPFIYQLARGLALTGFVQNSPEGVHIEIEGIDPDIDSFLRRLKEEAPPHAAVGRLWLTPVPAKGSAEFEIRNSETRGLARASLLPDLATCPACLNELLDPGDRRFGYPFINCTHCGPRYTILEALPYDRRSTTMKRFAMCARCQAEYDDPADRRFHAQPNACPDCGPSLALWDGEGRVLARRGEALQQAVQALSDGKIVALKGIGGFQLLVDPANAPAVRRLRERKRREAKPLALLARDLESARRLCHVSPLEERVLCSAAAPIVLLQRRKPVLEPWTETSLIAPGCQELGLMLPYSPLHHLVMRAFGPALVATSGNLTDEPICTDEQEAPARLRGIADLFLVHDRPIARYADDSVVRVMLGRELFLRRARGYAPLSIPLSGPSPAPSVLAVGGHLKNTVAVAWSDEAVVSPHIGDLETAPALEAFDRVVGDLRRLQAVVPEWAAADLHPGYLSRQRAEGLGLPLVAVQHHYAHVLACMADNDLEEPVLGVAWDGSGLGDDGTLWGGEFLAVDAEGYRRKAWWRPFPLPGGEKAFHEPCRAALGLLYELGGAKALGRTDLAPVRHFSEAERGVLQTLLERRVQAPATSSVGRLFDAAAALIGLRQRSRFEAQAAMDLENAAALDGSNEAWPPALRAGGSGGWILDWAPMFHALLRELAAGVTPGRLAARFQNALVEGLLEVARREGIRAVALAGGCFQNRMLLERAVSRLREAGFRPYWPLRLPPNDGGIALGQIVAARRHAWRTSCA